MCEHEGHALSVSLYFIAYSFVTDGFQVVAMVCSCRIDWFWCALLVLYIILSVLDVSIIS